MLPLNIGITIFSDFDTDVYIERLVQDTCSWQELPSLFHRQTGFFDIQPCLTENPKISKATFII